MANTRKTIVTYKGNGTQKVFAFPFDYLRKSFVMVMFDGVGKTYGVDYTVTSKQVEFTTPPANGVVIVIYRETATDRLVAWEDASVLRASDMTLFEVQLLHLAEETQDKVQESGLAKDDYDGIWDARLTRIKNVLDPVDALDVINKRYFESTQAGFIQASQALVNEATNQKNQATTQAQNSASSASAALASQNAAKTSETNAKTSETNAKASENAAKTSETNAKTSETNAKTSETNAKASENAAKNSEIAAKASQDACANYQAQVNNQAGFTKAESDARYAFSGFGLGVQINRVDDANSLTKTGFYYCLTNLPIGLNDANIYHHAYSDTWAHQLCFGFGPTYSGTVYVRIKKNGVWQEWKQQQSRPNITWLSNGKHNVCALIADGKLYTASGTSASWSNSTTGRGLNGQSTVFGVGNLKQVNIPYNANIVKAAGFAHASAFVLMDDGTLWGWGQNSNGQLGVGNATAYPVPILCATGVVDIYDDGEVGNYSVDTPSTFIKKTDGYVYACGYNTNGQLGIGTTANATTWTQCTALGTGVVNIWRFGNNACPFSVALKSDGSLWVTGYNGTGQLGIGNTTQLNTWTNVSSYWGVTATNKVKLVFGCGGYYNSAANSGGNLGLVLDDGYTTTVKTCGYGNFGFLGNGGTGNISIPFTALSTAGAGRIVDIVAMGGSPCTIHALDASGKMYGWGYNSYGQIGVGHTNDVLTPVVVESSGVTKMFMNNLTAHIYSYRGTFFYTKSDGYLYACGRNANGQCGNGYTADVLSPTRVYLPYSASSNVKFMGGFATTADGWIIVLVTNDNTIYTWGYNGNYGVTGDPIGGNILIPVQVNLEVGA